LAAGVHLEVYGLTIAVGGDWPEVCERVRLDYAWFQSPVRSSTPDVEVTIEHRPPDYGSFADAIPWFVTPRNAVYRLGSRIVLDHIGVAVSVLDANEKGLWIQGEDEHVVHDAVYYFLLGRIGQHLDARGLVRLHALGLAGRPGAVALLLPPGGGKTTLALEAIKDDAVRLLSEDSPLLDRAGRVHPFPLRIGVNANNAQQLPAGASRRIERVWLHPKIAVEVETFADRVATEPEPLRHLVIGCRSLAATPTLVPLTRRAAVGPLFRDAVVGAGLYQGLGYAHQRGGGELFGKLRTAAARARVCGAALERAKVWRLTLCRDSERNWEALCALLR
jgi:hypothetical protein